MSKTKEAKASPIKVKIKDLNQLKGMMGDRCLKMLGANKDKVVFHLTEGEELTGVIRGVGQYTILINNEGEDTLLFKNCVKYVKARGQQQSPGMTKRKKAGK